MVAPEAGENAGATPRGYGKLLSETPGQSPSASRPAYRFPRKSPNSPLPFHARRSSIHLPFHSLPHGALLVHRAVHPKSSSLFYSIRGSQHQDLPAISFGTGQDVPYPGPIGDPSQHGSPNCKRPSRSPPRRTHSASEGPPPLTLPLFRHLSQSPFPTSKKFISPFFSSTSPQPPGQNPAPAPTLPPGMATSPTPRKPRPRQPFTRNARPSSPKNETNPAQPISRLTSILYS